MQRQRQPQTHSPRRETINILRGVAAGTGAVSDTAQVACCRLQQHHVYSHRFGRASRAEIAQLVARRSHNPKVVSSIFTFRMLHVGPRCWRAPALSWAQTEPLLQSCCISGVRFIPWLGCLGSMTVWPSGLRRWLQAQVRKSVGSNPTAVRPC